MGVIPIRQYPPEILGTWLHAVPEDSDDYTAEYTISEKNAALVVTGKCLDGEAFEITDVNWDGEWLRFRSLMPSTGRTGLNEFRVNDADAVEARFTFTTTEVMKRKRP